MRFGLFSAKAKFVFLVGFCVAKASGTNSSGTNSSESLGINGLVSGDESGQSRFMSKLFNDITLLPRVGAVMSSVWPADQFSADNAIDSDTAGEVAATNGDWAPWLMIDLGSSFHIGGVVIFETFGSTR